MGTRSGPRFTEAQQLGILGEAKFAALASHCGAVWHPTLRNDFGLDGRLEFSIDGQMVGPELNVQIKARSTLTVRNDRIALGSIKLRTIDHWMSKLVPTVLIAFDATADKFWYAWADGVIPDDLLAKKLAGRKTFRVNMPAAVLTPDTWSQLHEGAHVAHEAIRSALENLPARAMYHSVYCLTADVVDVLTDVLTWAAFELPESLPKRFLRADPQTLQDLSLAFEAQSPTPPKTTIQSSYAIVLIQVQALVHMIDAFIFGAPYIYHADDPIVRVTVRCQAEMKDILTSLGLPAREADSVEAKAGTLSVVNTSLVSLVYGLGEILLILRDYQRQMRPWLFTFLAHIEDMTPQDAPLAMCMVRDIAAESVTEASRWGFRQTR